MLLRSVLPTNLANCLFILEFLLLYGSVSHRNVWVDTTSSRSKSSRIYRLCLWRPGILEGFVPQNGWSCVCREVSGGGSCPRWSLCSLAAGPRLSACGSPGAAGDPRGSCPATWRAKQRGRSSSSNWLTTSRMSCEYTATCTAALAASALLAAIMSHV